MKNKLLKSLICTVLVALFAIGAVPCYAANSTASEVNSLVTETISHKAGSLGVSGVQGIVNYYSNSPKTLGGEWYVFSFIQHGDYADFSSFEKGLIDYLKNNTVYSATTREKFALTLIALNTKDQWALKYIGDVANEAIGKQGIMSYIYGLHLLNNGCVSSTYTKNDVINSIISLKNSDGGWSISGSNSDVDVTAMALQALAPHYYSQKNTVDSAVTLLSNRQSADGDFQSYGTYNAESTAQVIIALSALGINPDSDSRFVKNGKSCLDGLLRYKTDTGFSHTLNGGTNISASSQALNALVALWRMKTGRGSFYSMPNKYVPVVTTTGAATSASSARTTTANNTDSSVSKPNSTVPDSSSFSQIDSQSETAVGEKNSKPTDKQDVTSGENTSDVQSTEPVGEISEENITQSNADDVKANRKEKKKSDISIVNPFKNGIEKYKIIASAIVLGLAILISIILFIIKKRNYKNFIAIFAIAALLIAVITFTNISSAENYYGQKNDSGKTVGAVSITVRCDTIIGKKGAPENPVILEKTQFAFSEEETVYDALAAVLKENNIMFEHDASYYISGIDNLYEYEFGELSGWMYLVNGETPSVGCGEYKLKDGDEIEWLYTCDIGNDLKK